MREFVLPLPQTFETSHGVWMSTALLPFAAPFLVALLHLIAQRLLCIRSQQRLVVRLALCVPCTFFLASVLLRKPVSHSFYLFVTTLGFTYTYFHFFNMSESARRVQLLMRFYQHVDLPAERLFESYSPKQMVENRLERLLKMNVLFEREGKYFVRSGGMLLAAQCFGHAIWKRLF